MYSTWFFQLKLPAVAFTQHYINTENAG